MMVPKSPGAKALEFGLVICGPEGLLFSRCQAPDLSIRHRLEQRRHPFGKLSLPSDFDLACEGGTRSRQPPGRRRYLFELLQSILTLST